MRPIKTDSTKLVYGGPTPEIGDLWCERVEDGYIRSFWKPSEEELDVLNQGGCVELGLFNEPIPPISVGVSSKESVGDHPFRIKEGEQ